MKIIFTIFFTISFLFPLYSQQQMKIMTYNLLNYPNTDTNIRNPHFRTVISSINPDVIVVNEINSLSGVNAFLNNVLNYSSAAYSAGTYINGFDSDNALFYKTSKFNFISNTVIPTLLRDINEFKITDKFYSDTLRIYAVHLRAGDTSIIRRGAEADSLRKRTNQLPAGTNFIVLGDFNIYGSTEPAYQKLIQDNPGDDGNFIDPLVMTGIWNNINYDQYHTQSTRTRSFGDGATGGLDDRFDMILYSSGVKNNGGIKYIIGSLTPFGNDGNHFNDSINQIPNTAVSQSIANALHYASDHLPVYSNFEFGNATAINIKVIPEGLYNISLNQMNRRDSVIFYLRNNVSPYNKIDSFKTLIDSVSFNASAVSRIANSGTYYIQVKHWNSIETWSSSGGTSFTEGITFNYDFTNSADKAFGNNMTLKGSRYCIYSGDLDGDGTIDATDLSIIDNDAFNFVTGFVNSDLDGNSFVDASDASIADNNAYNFIVTIKP
ncbi:MAG: endonuclease/exonuclease/phosphatase family protein [Ignavibacteria bacterium]